LSLRRRSPPAPQARQDGLDVQGEGADEHRSVEPYAVRNTSRISVCRTPVEHQAILFSTSSLGILSSVVAISVTSKRRPPRPRSPPRSPPLAPADTQHNTASRSGRQTDSLNAQQPDRTACCAPRGRDGGGRASSSKCWRDGRGWKCSWVAALRSAGPRQNRHRSASASRAAYRPARHRERY